MSDFFYGGQAVIEGVMMRGPKKISVAVRREDQEMVIHKQELDPLSRQVPILNLPVIRGSVALIDSLRLGIGALSYSANQFLPQEEQEQMGTKEMAFTIGLSVLLAIGLFVVLPALLTGFVGSWVKTNLFLNLIEGVVKGAVFLLYIYGISFVPYMRRVLQYHGAEHKVINAFEAGVPLEVEAVRPHSIRHPRCGTNFLLLTLFISLVVFSIYTSVYGRPWVLLRVGVHLLLLPLVAGLSYELIRAAGKKDGPGIFRALATPGLALQALTTREPDDEQIEVAIFALKGVLEE